MRVKKGRRVDYIKRERRDNASVFVVFTQQRRLDHSHLLCSMSHRMGSSSFVRVVRSLTSFGSRTCNNDNDNDNGSNDADAQHNASRV